MKGERKHVALVGFMSAGKSSVGAALARELGWEFSDSDAELVARHGPISAIFVRAGEAGFRELEFEIVQELVGLPARVIALGGGAVTYAPTRDLLAERALRVYLDVPLETLLARLRRSHDVRPLLGAAPARATLRALLAAREPLYRESEIVVRGRRCTRAALARDIAARIEDYESARSAAARRGAKTPPRANG